MTERTVSTPVPLASTQIRRRMARFSEFWFYFCVNQRRCHRSRRSVFVLLVFIALLPLDRAACTGRSQYRDALLTPPFMAGGRQTDLPARHRCRWPGPPLAPDLWRPLFIVHRRHRHDYRASFSGIFLGVLAGYFRGWVDTLIMRIMDIILAFPSLLLALVLVAILGPGLFNAMIAIALVFQPHLRGLPVRLS